MVTKKVGLPNLFCPNMVFIITLRGKSCLLQQAIEEEIQ